MDEQHVLSNLINLAPHMPSASFMLVRSVAYLCKMMIGNEVVPVRSLKSIKVERG